MEALAGALNSVGQLLAVTEERGTRSFSAKVWIVVQKMFAAIRFWNDLEENDLQEPRQSSVETDAAPEALTEDVSNAISPLDFINTARLMAYGQQQTPPLHIQQQEVDEGVVD